MKRNINGILLLDKPINFTSNSALKIVKNIFGATKVGHTGSLDPVASGMLALCFGKSTKFSRFLLESDKKYLVTGKLGETTSSGDNETSVIKKRNVTNLKIQNIEKILKQFRGNINQIPPMYSAIKHNGEPLYKLARKGIEIPRNPRNINIHKLELLNLTVDTIDFEIHCSKGTYIRTLISDIGDAIGCGAHVIALRRIAVGPYKEEQMITLNKLNQLALNSKNKFEELDKTLLTIETIVPKMHEITLNSDMYYYALLGHQILASKIPINGFVKLKSENGDFLGIGEIMKNGKIAPKILLHNK